MLKCFVVSFPSTPMRQMGHGDCLEDKTEDCENCSVLYSEPLLYMIIISTYK